MIGLDGATFDVIQPLMDNGKLPVLSKLISTGASGVLTSTIPDISPVAWTSMVTGKRPGNHAIFDFIARQPGHYTFTSTRGGERGSPTIWSLLSERGKRVGIINVTMSYPPEEVLGFMVSGLDSPDPQRNLTYPAALYAELTAKIGRYLLTNPYALTTREKHLQGMFEMLDCRLAAARYLAANRDWDFFFVVFIATDGAQHFYWKDMDCTHPAHDPSVSSSFKNAIAEVYTRLDEGIGELIEGRDDLTVLIVSDHGFQPLHKLFVLNNWLLQEGYLRLKNGFRRYLNRDVWLSFARNMKHRLAKRPPRLPFQPIDWEKTRAFADGTYGYIYLNVKDREPQGIVRHGQEYDSLCAEIAAKLKMVRDPSNGMPVVQEVHRREAVFSGTYADAAPDLIVTSQRNYFVSASRERLPTMAGRSEHADDLFQDHSWSGIHDPNGIFILNGPGVKPGFGIEGAKVIDIAPTVLYLLNQEIPSDMDGQPLLDAFTAGRIKIRKPRFRGPGSPQEGTPVHTEISAEDDEAIRERLRALGYLD